MCVPANPRSELDELWRKNLKKFGGPIKVKVVDKGGKYMKSELKKSNPRLRSKRLLGLC